MPSPRATLAASSLFALTTFALPWMELSCGDKPIYQQRGHHVATGHLSPTPHLDALAQEMGAIPSATPDDPDQAASVAGAPWVWAFPAGALLTLLAAALWVAKPTLSARLGGAGAALCTLTLLAALTLRLPLEAEVTARTPPEAAAQSPFRVRKAYGFFLALLASLSCAFAASHAASANSHQNNPKNAPPQERP